MAVLSLDREHKGGVCQSVSHIFRMQLKQDRDQIGGWILV